MSKLFQLILCALLTSFWVAGATAEESAQEAAEEREEAAEEAREEAAEAAEEDADMDADDIFEEVQEAWEELQDYTCKMRTFAKNGAEEENSVIELHFKKPISVRSHKLEGGNAGGTAIREKDGSLRGKTGGVLGLIAINVKDDDPRIRDVRGSKFYESPWGVIIEDWEHWIDELDYKLIRVEDAELMGEKVFVIEIHGTQKHDPARPDSRVTRDLMWVDKETFLMRRRQEWEGDLLVGDLYYYDIAVNQNFPDELFDF